MVKLPKFVIQYAKYQKERYQCCQPMKEEYKISAIERIEKIVCNAEKGLITINEAMRLISDPLAGIVEKG